jgi:hypothetical protein
MCLEAHAFLACSLWKQAGLQSAVYDPEQHVFLWIALGLVFGTGEWLRVNLEVSEAVC